MSKYNCLCICFIMLTFFGHCGPSAGHKRPCSRYGRTYATNTLGIPQASLLTPLGYITSHEVYIYIYICTLNSKHFAYRTSHTHTTYICTLTLSTLIVEHMISSIRINSITTRYRWKFRLCTTTYELTCIVFLIIHFSDLRMAHREMNLPV